MIELTITFDDDESDQAWMLFGELEYRFGRDHVLRRANVVDDALTDDEVANDIELLHEVRMAIEHSDGPSDALERVSAIIPTRTSSNAQMHWLDNVVSALRAQSDATPPHGIVRPNLPPRPKATGGTALDKQTKAMLRDMVACPTCRAPIGQFCGSRDPSQTGTYGAQHMHEARIDAVYGAAS